MSDILVDTSAWVEFFRDPLSQWGKTVDLLLGEERVCTTALVMVEVVSGARNRAEFERLRTDFQALPRVDPPPSLWEDMLESRWRLKTQGITGVSIPDLIVAHVALAHGKVILTRDKDFWRMESTLGLSIFYLPEVKK